MDAQGIIKGSFGEVSNRADWILDVAIDDADTGDPLDISSATIDVQIQDINNAAMLTASTANGKVTIPESGVFKFTFTAEEMSALPEAVYNVGIRMTLDSVRYQLFIATVSVLEGHVP